MQSEFRFIPEVFSGVEVRALCRTRKFFHLRPTSTDSVFMELAVCAGASSCRDGSVPLRSKRLR